MNYDRSIAEPERPPQLSIHVSTIMPDKLFLETYPLYRKFRFAEFSEYTGHIPRPPINGYCDTCKSNQTFIQDNFWSELDQHDLVATAGRSLRAQYLCSACRNFRWTFFIHFYSDGRWIEKIGQWPPWSIAIDPTLERILDSHAPEFKKGLTNESQGYGIGAFAYYRRIVEEIIDRLLEEIRDLIPDPQKETYLKALEKAKATIVAQEKIDIVKDLLPQTLRPGGMNPLGVLHSALSEGLHGHSDEECLSNAEVIREVLVFLVTQVLEAKNSAKKFTSGMQKLLDKKNKST